MAFPDINSYPVSHPGPYERNMGVVIAKLLLLFSSHVRDGESALRVSELAATPSRWSAGHKVFDEVRHRAHSLPKPRDPIRSYQYYFEEMCCKAMYNAANPCDPFDPSAPFFIAAAAFRRALALEIPVDAVAGIFAPPR